MAKLTDAEEYAVQTLSDYLLEMVKTRERVWVASVALLAVRRLLKSSGGNRRIAVAVTHLDNAWRWLVTEDPDDA